MVLTLEEVRKIATLVRLRMSAEEEGRLVPQLGRIVEYIDQLQRLPPVLSAAADPLADEAAA